MVAASPHAPSQRRESRQKSGFPVSSGRGPGEAIPTEFRATCAAVNVYLAVRGNAGDAQICAQMDHVGQNEWRLTLRLQPGRYRYRYYAIHDTVTTYVSPGDVENRPVRMQGFDALLVVASPKHSHS